ncbi:MAG: ribulose-phosphate 3-epimerase [Chloroflexia bacterium]|nr:ribulose-phosphate 3-epimerase [Chloroflexia bacterium]MBA3643397.1 ribulose-phosphate 3-epimerase [Chloroflexia bacterium]
MIDTTPTEPVRIGPSILSADFLRLGQEAAAAERGGADYLHFDVMDGRFVPNISIGLPVLTALRGGTSLPIDVHLMIVEPERWVEPFVTAGANSVTVHAEATMHLHRLMRAITDAGAEPGVAINPATPLTALDEILPFVQRVLVMTVNPGFGGQAFIPAMLDKVRRLRATIDRVNPRCRIQVDGGITIETIRPVVDAGASLIVAGSAIYNDRQSVAEALGALRSAVSVS